ncbi:MAG TPA: GPP34 family phosphoprotein [Kineosporiaceae bacterium]|nr:GPP34 family phosphoprotein [Kineosporiaceae bacterium]
MALFLADDLFLMCHDLRSGKPRITESLLGIGLSSALLAELMFSGCIVVADAQLLIGEYQPPDDQLAEALFEQARAQLFTQQVSLPDWISSRRHYVVDLVADRLVREQHVVRDQHRRLGRSVTRYLPVRSADVFMRGQRLATFLRNRMELTELDVVLASLLTLVSVGSDLIELDDDGRDHLERLIPQLPIPLRELLASTENAVTGSLRSPRG